jgi:hypothetical protein
MSNAAAIRAGRGVAPGRSPARARRMSRFARFCLAAAMAAAALFLLARFAALPLLTIRHVLLQGDSPLSREETMRLAGLRSVEYWHTVPCVAIQKRLEADPLVRRARVERIFPGTLRMTVDRRLPVALVLGEAGGRSVPLLVDGDGYLFKIGATAAEIELSRASPRESSASERASPGRTPPCSRSSPRFATPHRRLPRFSRRCASSGRARRGSTSCSTSPPHPFPCAPRGRSTRLS